jgi:hypothetical protein
MWIVSGINQHVLIVDFVDKSYPAQIWMMIALGKTKCFLGNT